MILTKFSKMTMLHVVLNWQKISKTILEKAFFFIVWHFYLFFVFVLINFKVIIEKRKKMGLGKIRKQFFNYSFFGGHFVTKTSLLF